MTDQYTKDLERRYELMEKKLEESQVMLSDFIFETLDIWYAAKALGSVLDRIDRHYLDELEKELPPEVRQYLQNSIAQLNKMKDDKTVDKLMNLANKVRENDDYRELRDAVREEGEGSGKSSGGNRGRKRRTKKKD